MTDVKTFNAATDRSTKAIVTATTGLGKVVAELRKQIDAERETRLAIAQAESGRQGVVVNAGK